MEGKFLKMDYDHAEKIKNGKQRIILTNYHRGSLN